MGRAEYFNYIEEKLTLLSTRIKLRGKLNILDLHIHSEMFYCELLNLLFDYKLVNLNTFKQNFEGIDLVDEETKIIIQISSTCTKQKIESSLNKKILTNYQGYRFKFVSISGDLMKIRNKSIKNQYNIQFSSNDDILDITRIMKEIFIQPIDKLEKIYDLVKKELGTRIEDFNFNTLQDSYAGVLAEDMKELFVKTTLFDTGLNALENSNILILEGRSGIGKTSSAIMIANTLAYENSICKLTFKEGSDKLESKSIEGLLESLKKSIKEQEIIIFDDFLGKTKLTESEDYLEQIEELLKFMKHCKTKKIVLTTRSTIFENVKNFNAALAQYFIYDSKVLQVAEEYVVDDRISLLVKYILKNGIRDKIGALLKDKKVLHKIITHVNFSPLIMDRATSDCGSKGPEQFGKTILNHLENPTSIWEKEVSALDDYSINYLFVLYSLSDTFIEQKIVDECFDHFNKIIGIKKLEDFNDTRERLKVLLSFDNANNISFRHPSVIDYLSKKKYPIKENLISAAVYFEQIERLDENEEKTKELLLNPEEFFMLKVLPFRYANINIPLSNSIVLSYLKCILKCNFQNRDYENIVVEALKIVFQHGNLLLMWASDVVIDILNLKYYNLSVILNNEEYIKLIYQASNSYNVWKLIEVTEDKDNEGYDFSGMNKYVQNVVVRKLEETASLACEEYIATSFESYMRDYIDDYSEADEYEEIAQGIIESIVEDFDVEQVGRDSMNEAINKIGLYNVDINSIEYELYNYESLIEDYAINLIEEYFLYV